MKYIALILCVAFIMAVRPPVFAQTTSGVAMSAQPPATFVKKRYSIDGSWEVTEENGVKTIRFHDDFRTKGGPDLKVYLSSLSIEDLDSGMVQENSLKLSVLKSNKGSQSYIIPAEYNLSEYKSLVIHCEAFSVLWGGFNFAETP